MSAAQGQGEGTPVNAERDRAWIAARIPHQGRMCLLDAVSDWSAEHIECATCCHMLPLREVSLDPIF